MIAIIDYGMGNIHSVQKALEFLGAETFLTNKPKDLMRFDKAVLPGVGAFDDAVAELRRRGLISALTDYIKQGKIFLGICLGMQLLFETSQEGKLRGLNILKGRVRRFNKKSAVKIPHIGWNQLNLENKGCPLLKGLADKSYVYFCHSYYPGPARKEAVAATTDYGIKFTSIVWQDNVFGVQFHPEKSQEAGLKILNNFVNAPTIYGTK